MNLLEKYQEARKGLFDAYRDTREISNYDGMEILMGEEKEGVEVFVYCNLYTINYIIKKEMFSIRLGTEDYFNPDLGELEDLLFDMMARDEVLPC